MLNKSNSNEVYVGTCFATQYLALSSDRRVREIVADKELFPLSYKVGKKWRIHRDELKNYKDLLAAKPKPSTAGIDTLRFMILNNKLKSADLEHIINPNKLRKALDKKESLTQLQLIALAEFFNVPPTTFMGA